jgi:monoamine oxidase
MTKKTIAVVGAGLSGLSCCFMLVNLLKDVPNIECNIVCLEGRHRVGGRMFTKNSVDLGAAWCWPTTDKQLVELSKFLDVVLEQQQSIGTALLHSSSGTVPYGNNIGPAGSGSWRFSGGAGSLAQKLAAHLQNSGVDILTNNFVCGIKQIGGFGSSSPPSFVEIDVADSSTKSTTSTITADCVVLALPPNLIVPNISFTPDLSSIQKSLMLRIPTWMANAGKVAFTYPSAFWKEKGLNGCVFCQDGPLTQIWDNSAPANSPQGTLTGFLFDENLKYLESEDTIFSSPIMHQLVSCFGNEALRPIRVVWKSWAADILTAKSTSDVFEDVADFGHYDAVAPHGLVLFAGTETAPNEHGHMNGAVVAGYRAAREALKLLTCYNS